jgi:hypothetical protein
MSVLKSCGGEEGLLCGSGTSDRRFYFMCALPCAKESEEKILSKLAVPEKDDVEEQAVDEDPEPVFVTEALAL